MSFLLKFFILCSIDITHIRQQHYDLLEPGYQNRFMSSYTTHLSAKGRPALSTQ